MNALLWLALALSAGGLALCGLKLRRGDLRVGWLALAFTSLCALVGSRLWVGTPDAIGFNAATFGGLGLVAAAAFAGGSLVALSRTLRERDHAEDLHWDSMETVRKLGELAARPPEKRADALRALLEIGCQRFDLDVGLVVRMEDDSLEIEQLYTTTELAASPEALSQGLARAVRQTCAADRPLVLSSRDGLGEGPGGLELAAFLGTSFGSDGSPWRCLVFASERTPRRRLTATDKDLMGLLGVWLAQEIVDGSARSDAGPGAAARSEQPRATAAPRRRARARKPAPVELRVDANAALRRLRPVLARRAGPAAPLELALAEDLAPVRMPRVSLRTIAESLVLGATSISNGGALKLFTANVEGNAEKPLETAEARAEPFVTLGVRIEAEDVEAEAVSQLLAPKPRGASARPDDPLPLLRLQKLLQRDGGDLSVELEPGRCASFTAFLPAVPCAERGTPSADGAG